MRPRNDARLVPAALGVYVVAATVMAGVVPPQAWVAIGLGGALVLAWRGSGVGVGFVGIAIVVAALVSALHAEARLAGGVADALASGDEVAFAGIAAGDARPVAQGLRGEPRWSLEVRLDSLGGRPEGSARATVRVIGGGSWGEVRAGDRVTGVARLEGTGPGRAVAVAWDPELLGTEPATGLGGVVGSLRQGLRDAASGLPDETRALTVGMTIGDTSGMSEVQREKMRIAGLTHLTAVSGAQFGMLALAVGAATRALGWGRRVRVAVLILAAAGFVSLVHPEPSVVRAGWMVGVLALALLWGRPGQALPALCSAVIGLLLIDPFLALSYGFALSVIATAGIVLWSPLVAVALSGAMPVPLARGLSVPFAAQVVCAPVLVLFTDGIGSYSVLANFVALPFATLATAFGLGALLLSPISGPCGVACAWVAGQAAQVVAWAAHMATILPGSWIPWPSGVVGAVLAAGVAASLVVATSSRRTGGWARLACLVAILAVLASPPVRGVFAEAGARAPGDWAVAICDVGQGDMILIRAGPSSAVVIDVGPEGEEALECLNRHGVSAIPLLVLTHPHADHDGGLGWVLSRVPVGEAWVSEPGQAGVEWSLLDEAGVKAEVPSPGTTVWVGDARIVVWHDGDPAARSESEVNDSSLVVIAEAGGIRLLSLGDLEEAGQASLRRSLGPTLVDVLKVAHHGSSRQDPGLRSLVVASIAVVSVGTDNPYGHPAASTMEGLAGLGLPVYRTDECGDIDVSWRGGVVVTATCPIVVGG